MLSVGEVFNWFRYIRGAIYGATMIGFALLVVGFDDGVEIGFSAAFILVGSGLVALMVWSAIRDYRRFKLQATPVAEPPARA